MPVLTVKQPTRTPTRKIGRGLGIGGSASILVIYLLNNILGIDVPPEVSGAIGVFMVFLVSYFTKERA